MKIAAATIAVAALTAGLMSLPPQAEAKGCLKGAAVGGVAGHMVGSGHGVAGAAAGCVIGRHEANKKDEAKQQAEAPQNQTNPPPKK